MIKNGRFALINGIMNISLTHLKANPVTKSRNNYENENSLYIFNLGNIYPLNIFMPISDSSITWSDFLLLVILGICKFIDNANIIVVDFKHLVTKH